MSIEAAVESRLADRIYSALLHETTWQSFLDGLAATLPDGRSTLFYHDVDSGAGAWELTSGLPADVVSDYASHYAKLNPWMPAASRRKIGIGVVAEQMLPREQFVKTPFYNDFFRPMVGESAVGVTLARERGQSMLLSITTSRADPEKNRDVADLLTRLAPHLRRAFRYANRRSAVASEIGRSVCQKSELGVVVVDEGARAINFGAQGQAMVEAGRVLRLTTGGKLHIRDSDADAALHGMLRRGFDGDTATTFVLGSTKLTLIRTCKDCESAYFEGPSVIVLIESQAKEPPLDLRGFASANGLTAAELRAMQGLISGQNAARIADAAGISRETVRTQVKSLYGKLGVRSQMELLRISGLLRMEN